MTWLSTGATLLILLCSGCAGGAPGTGLEAFPYLLLIVVAAFAASGWLLRHRLARQRRQHQHSHEQLWQAEHDALTNRIAFLQSLINEASDAFIVTSLDGRVVEANAKALEMTGYGYDEIKKMDGFLLIAEEERESARVTLGRVTAGDSTLHDRLLCRKDGSTFVAEVSARRMDDGRLLALVRDISERKRMEEALRASEERFRIISHGTSDAVWDWDIVSNVVWWGEGLRTGLGYLLADMTTDIEWWAGLIHPDDAERVQQSLEMAVECDDDHWSQEYRFCRSDGTYAHIIDRGYVIRDGMGKATRMVGAMVDISERKHAEQALRDSEERYRKLAETSGVGIWQVTPEGHTIYANPAMCAMLGYNDIDEINQHSYETYFTPEGLRRVRREYVRRRHGIASSYEIEFKRSNGEVRTAIAYGAPLLGPDGDLHSRIGTFIDVTERKQAEQALQESEARFRQLTDNINEVFWLIDAATQEIIYLSPAYERVWGMPREAAYANPHMWLNSVHPNDRARVELTTRTIAEDGTDVEYRVVQPDGTTRWVRSRGFPVRDAARNVHRLAGIVEDITERKEFEAHLQHSQKLESLGVLAGGIAHDFNNLLLGILGNADLALMELSHSSPGRHYIEDAVRICQRAADLCNQMLAYSGKGKFVIEALDLCHIVQEMSHLLEVSINKKAVLKYNFAKNLPPMEGDATQIRQVIMNLITNASDALDDKSGVISLATGSMYCSREYLSETYLDEELPEADYVYFEVADNGCGMSREICARVFDPFFTTKFTGRGLGLAAVLGIVRAHHGAIKVYSEPSQGSVFRVLFPVSHQAVDRELAQQVVPSAAPKGGLILLVDDEEPIRLMGKKVLDRAGYQVLTAADGLEALAIFQQHADEISVVVLDMTMPRMSGEEAFREMRCLRPDVRVLLSSGYSEGEATNRFKGKGLAGFLQKPYRPQVLLERLVEIIGARTDFETDA